MGGHGHAKIKIPDYKIYKVEDAPPLLQVQEKLANAGLRDPWLRNEVWRYNPELTGGNTVFQRIALMVTKGLMKGIILCAATIGGELIYKMMKDKSHSGDHGPPPPPSDVDGSELSSPPETKTENETVKDVDISPPENEVNTDSSSFNSKGFELPENNKESSEMKADKSSKSQNINTQDETKLQTNLNSNFEPPENTKIPVEKTSHYFEHNSDYEREKEPEYFTTETYGTRENVGNHKHTEPPAEFHQVSFSGETDDLGEPDFDNERRHPEYTDCFSEIEPPKPLSESTEDTFDPETE